MGEQREGCETIDRVQQQGQVAEDRPLANGLGELARFVANLEFKDFHPGVVERLRQIVVDLITIVVAGKPEPEMCRLAVRQVPEDASRCSTVLGH